MKKLKHCVSCGKILYRQKNSKTNKCTGCMVDYYHYVKKIRGLEKEHTILETSAKVKYKNSLLHNNDMKKVITLLVVALTFIFLIGGISALESLGNFKQGETIRVSQVCSDATYINLSSISFPNSTIAVDNIAMISSGSGGFYYDFSNTSDIGRYDVRGISDGCDKTFATYFDITKSGIGYDSSQGILIFGEIGIIALLVAIAFSFSKEKWKIRTAFFMFALLVGVIALNSIRIIVSMSENLSTMANAMLILGIVILSFMFMYMLIYYTIEVFNYFKNKHKMKWEVSTDSQ